MENKINTIQSKKKEETSGSEINQMTSQVDAPNTQLDFKITLRGIEFKSSGYSKDDIIAIMKNTLSIKRTGLWLTVLLCALLFIWILSNCKDFISMFLPNTS